MSGGIREVRRHVKQVTGQILPKCIDDRMNQLLFASGETPTSCASGSQCLGCGRRRPARISAA
jgi:hypothetical protein